MNRMSSFDIQTKDNRIAEYQAAIADIKRLMGGFQQIEALMEEKAVVRHVRNSAYWGLPVGTIIVDRSVGKKKNTRKLGHIHMDVGASDKLPDGEDVYVGSMDSPTKGSTAAAKFTVKKEGRKYVAYDEEDNPVAEGKDEVAVLESLDKYNKDNSHVGKTGNPLPADRGNRTVEDEMAKQDPKKKRGIHAATPADYKKYPKLSSRRLVDVFFFDEVRPDDVSVGYGYDRNGGQQPFRRAEGVAKKEEAKAQVVVSIDAKMDEFDAQARQDMQDNDTALACYLMRVYGFRVGTIKSDRGTTTTEAFGATQIQKKHVKVVGDTITFTIPSKKGATATPDPITDPELAAALKRRMRGKGPEDTIMAGTNAAKTDIYLKKFFGKDMTNHKLRAFRATEEAKAYVDGTLEEHGKMQSYEEFKAMANEINRLVSTNVLFDNPTEALKSYVDIHVLEPLASNPNWVKDYATSIAKSKNFVE